MGVVARRLQDTEEDWRHVYKSLLLLEFMSKHGPQKVRASECRQHYVHALSPCCSASLRCETQNLTDH